MIIGLSLPTCTAHDDQALAEAIAGVLELTVQQNVRYFHANPDAPCCLDCGKFKYREPAFSERMTVASAEDILRAGSAGCAGAACYMAAKDRMKGKVCRVLVTANGPRDFHAVVQYPDGSTFDPTLDMPS